MSILSIITNKHSSKLTDAKKELRQIHIAAKQDAKQDTKQEAKRVTKRQINKLKDKIEVAKQNKETTRVKKLKQQLRELKRLRREQRANKQSDDMDNDYSAIDANDSEPSVHDANKAAYKAHKDAIDKMKLDEMSQEAQEGPYASKSADTDRSALELTGELKQKSLDSTQDNIRHEVDVATRIQQLIDAGKTDAVIAVRLGVSIKTVIDARKNKSQQALIQNPRELFAKRLLDLDCSFETAKALFDEDPGSEVNYKIMVDFMKTMREFVTTYQELEDPMELAEGIVTKCLRPFVIKSLKTIVAGLETTTKNITPFLRDNERNMVLEGFKNATKQLQDNVNTDYNEAVDSLATIYGVDLSKLKVNK